MDSPKSPLPARYLFPLRALVLLALPAVAYAGASVLFPQIPVQPAPLPARLDINSAPSRVIAQLPGMTPRLARAITDSRARSGPFQSPEDLLRVPGISRPKAQTMLPYLRFSPHPPSTPD